jgi:hypothetical protein
MYQHFPILQFLITHRDKTNCSWSIPTFQLTKNIRIYGEISIKKNNVNYETNLLPDVMLPGQYFS